MLVIDGNGVSTRSFFGTHYNTGEFTESLWASAFLKGLHKLLTRFYAMHSNVVFCIDSPSWRKKVYPAYKDKGIVRDSVYGEYIHSYMDLMTELKRILPIHFIRKVGYEADDLLAYFSRNVQGEPVTIVGNDKDFVQLINNNVTYYNFVNESFLKVKDPALHLHTLICTGDTADNIPSIVPRNTKNKPKFMFGEKTAIKHYKPEDKNNICEQFLLKQLDKKDKDGNTKVVEEDLHLLHRNYKFNEQLIDLSFSPVHEESIILTPARFYDRKAYMAILRRYLPPRELDATFQKMDVILNTLVTA